MKEYNELSSEELLRYHLLQNEISKKVVKVNDFQNDIGFIAGVDVAYNDAANEMVGAIVVINAKTLLVEEVATHRMGITFPYVPGLFSFREIPAIIEAYHKLSNKPHLIICDGHGIAHPKAAGMASHLGVTLDVPTIGCAKKKLIGHFDKDQLSKKRGSFEKLMWDGKEVGAALRTQDDIKPVFVSIGHRISLSSSIEWVLKLAHQYRLPETTRQADQIVNQLIDEIDK